MAQAHRFSGVVYNESSVGTEMSLQRRTQSSRDTLLITRQSKRDTRRQGHRVQGGVQRLLCSIQSNPLSRTHTVGEFPDLEIVGPWGSNNVANQRMGNRRGGLFSDQRGSLSGVCPPCVAEIGLAESQRGVDGWLAENSIAFRQEGAGQVAVVSRTEQSHRTVTVSM